LSVLIVDFHEFDLGELFEIQVEQVGNIEILAFGCTDSLEIHVRDLIVYFKPAITCETVIHSDPSVFIFFL